MATALPVVDEVTPDAAYAALVENPNAVLVDVRTQAEWTFVGLPDLSEIDRDLWLIEWVQFPSMASNAEFLAQMRARLAEVQPQRLFFICRSGARSMAAAQHVAATFAAEGQALHCTNVAEGFQGDRDASGRRATCGGWQHHGLPWTQS